eukprot:TRINITY_DN4377_c0_g1_i4.p1 TRINITY_DN4377_c0_g1~~TRINITY_DN4377_c0_g1_i4.p1  ORF type:complete len:326 (+),score=25.35 TRINITY_DN4377_c0_g1_i4:327-1304(+)
MSSYVPPFFPDVVVPLAWTNIILSCFTFIVTNLFPKQRVFPVNIGSWVLGLTCCHFVLDLIRWTKYTSTYNAILDNPTKTRCFFVFGFEVWIQTAVVVCNVFMSFTMYNMIIKNRDMSYASNPMYLRTMVLIIIVWPLIIFLSVLSVEDYSGGCIPNGNQLNIFLVAQWGVAVFLEISFLSQVLMYIRRVVTKAKKMAQPTSKRTIWLAIRFTSLVCLQTIPRILYNIMYIKHDQILTYILYQPYYILAFVCFSSESLVILYGNRQLRKRLLRLAHKITNKSYSSESSSEDKIVGEEDVKGNSLPLPLTTIVFSGSPSYTTSSEV